MLLYRIGPEGFYAAADTLGGEVRFLHSDPFEVRPGGWELGRTVEPVGLMAPVVPGKVIGIGRNYGAHADELGNERPSEPLVFLKPPSSVIGPRTPIVLPAESGDVQFEGEIALVLRERVRRASAEDAAGAILGVTCAVDVTARDLQRADKTWARGKGFDTFCPLGPAIRLGADVAELTLVTRVNGEERQRGRGSEMTWGPGELVAWVSQTMTLEAGDVILTGTPAGVGSLADGDRLEVEVSGVGVLECPVEDEA
ncbi:MAG TPA: fumarylacetoacetate hydrolase family protein [Thermoanaerobaculia bacterium]|nr:fumarylacetoacetate hydrolase family protein [Thermoanaerobaculia bacterium]